MREVRAFAGVDLAIATHGAHVVNALFMPRGSALIELAPARAGAYYARSAPLARRRSAPPPLRTAAAAAVLLPGGSAVAARSSKTPARSKSCHVAV